MPNQSGGMTKEQRKKAYKVIIIITILGLILFCCAIYFLITTRNLAFLAMLAIGLLMAWSSYWLQPLYKAYFGIDAAK